MFYIFHGSDFQKTKELAIKKAESLTRNISYLSNQETPYKKEDLQDFLYYFLLPSDTLSILIIDNPETIHPGTLQTYLQLLEDLPENHSIFFVTTLIRLLPKTIISRALVFELTEKKKEKTDFIDVLTNTVIEDIQAFLEKNDIHEYNTKEKTILLMNQFPNKKTELLNLIDFFPEYIKNSHHHYWKAVYMIIKT
jgi:hypothetical protein